MSITKSHNRTIMALGITGEKTPMTQMIQGRDKMLHDHFHSISVLARNLQKVRETV